MPSVIRDVINRAVTAQSRAQQHTVFWFSAPSPSHCDHNPVHLYLGKSTTDARRTVNWMSSSIISGSPRSWLASPGPDDQDSSGVTSWRSRARLSLLRSLSCCREAPVGVGVVTPIQRRACRRYPLVVGLFMVTADKIRDGVKTGTVTTCYWSRRKVKGLARLGSVFHASIKASVGRFRVLLTAALVRLVSEWTS